jgi:nucleoside-diphosphate-sugar epimerase
LLKVVVTGGTGFTGERVVARLKALGIVPTVVARATSNTDRVRALGARIVCGNLDDARQLEDAFRGHDVLMHVASMGFGQVPGVVAAASKAGVRRTAFVSTTAVLTSLPVRSKPVRSAAERAVRESGLEWTIVRPTMIYGSARDRNMCRLLRHLRRWRVAPIPGSGRALQQPVHVDDVAEAIVSAALRPAAVGREYNVSGDRPMPLRELISHAAAAVGVRPIFVPLPTRLAARALRAAERSGLVLPLRSEQLERLNEHKAFDHSDATADLGFAPRSFAEGIRAEAVELGLTSQS